VWTGSPQSLISIRGGFWQSGMPKDPGSVFGGLLAACIRDDYTKEDGKFWAEGVLFVILGACSSVVTTYLLSLAGILV
jgi:hypothetical protein